MIGFFKRVALTAAFAALLMPSLARAQSLEKIKVSLIPTADATPLIAAIQKGYFREVGLDVETVPTAGGAAGVPGLIGGSFDVAYGNVVSTLLAAQQGLDVRIVAPGTKALDRTRDVTDLIVAADSGLKSGRDFEGKSIAVNTRNNVIWLYVRAWVSTTGGNPERVAFREVPFPQMEDALRQKRVDGAFMIPPFNMNAISKGGLQSIGKPYTDVQPNVDIGQYITTSKFLAERPQTVERFAKGLRKGVEWFNENYKTDSVYEVIAGITKLDIAVLRAIPLTPLPTKCDVSQMRKTMDLMIESKLLNGPIDIEKLVAPVAL